MKKILIFLFVGLQALTTIAQNKTETKQKSIKKERTIALWGHIKDSFTKVGIEGTKITLMRPDSTVVDSQVVNYFNGRTNKIDTYYRFNIPAQPQMYIIKAEHPDYYPTYVNFDIKYVARNNYFDAPWHLMKKRSIPIDQKVHNLNEVLVTATKIKMVIKGDTVIYNADAFNLPKGSMLDELIKQMPGVQLKDNGEIYMNGKKVDYLMLNGKQFFKGKNNVMLENLPYYTVKNVQFYNKTTDKSEYLGHDVEKKEYVMDVNLKNEYSTGYIANAEAAIGTYDRYLARLFGLRYTDNTRVSVFGNMNNVNEYRRPERDGDWSPTNSPESIIDTKRAGIDINIDDKDKRFTENFSGIISTNHLESISRSATESFLVAGNAFNRTENRSDPFYFFVNAENNFTLKKPFFLTINSSVNYSRNETKNTNRTVAFNANPVQYGSTSQILDSVFESSIPFNLKNIAINRQFTQGIGNGYLLDVTNSIVATKKLSWGDNFELSYDINYRNEMNSSFNAFELSYLQKNTSDNRNQYSTNPNKGYNYNARAEYTFHFLSNWNFLLYYIYSQKYTSEVKSLYRLDWLDGWASNSLHSLGELPSNRDSLLFALDAANTYNKEYWERSNKGGFRIFYEKRGKDNYKWFNLHFPFKYKNEQLNYMRNELDTCVRQKNWILQPDMTYILQTRNFNRTFSVNYSNVITTPDLASKINVTDNSNPLAIWMGNPDLKNTIRYNLNVSYSDREPVKQKFFNTSWGVSLNDNMIANGFTYNTATGVYIYKPQNVSGNMTMYTQLGYGNTIDKKKLWSFETQTSWNYNHNVDLTAVTGSTISAISKVNNNGVNEKLKLNYQQAALKLSVISQVQWNKATSKRQNFQTINAFNYSYGMTGEYKFFKKIDLSTDIKMYSRRGYDDESLNTNNLVWNASVASVFFKGKMMVRLEGFDLLHQLSNVNYYVNGQGKTETWRNSIPNYVMLHMSYRFSANPKKK